MDISINADLHMHGPIGFQPYYLKRQNYAKNNLLQLIADQAFSRGITISALTSHYITLDQPNDRFKCLIANDAKTLSSDYKLSMLGENLLLVQREDDNLFLINGQTVVAKEGEREFDILVVGSNKVPVHRSVKDTLNYCQDSGLIAIAEHPFTESHRGLGENLVAENANLFDAIEGYNSQLILPGVLSKLPVIGKVFSRAGSEDNLKAQELARKLKKPWIAVSDAHRIEDLGISYINWLDHEGMPYNEEMFMASLKQRIRRGSFTPVTKKEDALSWLSWTATFYRSITLDKNKIGSVYVPCENL